MRAVLIASAVLCLTTIAARAEDMVDGNPRGIMCRDEKALAAFTAPDGTMKRAVMANPASPDAVLYMNNCKDGMSATVHVITRRQNTSIVTYNGETWYVPNINFFTPGPDCIKADSHVTLTGTIQSAFQQDDEVNPKIGHHYPRLTLDRPVCYLGNHADKAGRYVSLPSTSQAGFRGLMKMVGQHVSVTGDLGSPDTGHQPPDNMMMFDPVVKRAS